MFVKSLKNFIDANSDDENEMTTAAPVPTSSKMKNIMENSLNGQYCTRVDSEDLQDGGSRLRGRGRYNRWTIINDFRNSARFDIAHCMSSIILEAN
ncbi:hypothetical protein TNCV_3505961 [Trichonephila clavipes]|uniref:Uncharacterized protein n=1 Tax=Trichonephila clavipes TaxID=2585209 RepID=A0A8X6RYX8_TRICX|nr:hypothetical protein TNCV_3505961 [Trichonephila clavipes]